MKSYLALLIFVSLSAQAQYRSEQGLIKSWEKSWNTYDLDAVNKLFVNDSSVTYFSSERAGLIHGYDSLLRHHRRFGFVPGGKTSPNRLWLTEVRYLGGSVTAIWHFQRPDNPEQRGPVTFVLRTSKDGFRIAHAHFSNDPKPK